jgi:hypothetical protein
MDSHSRGIELDGEKGVRWLAAGTKADRSEAAKKAHRTMKKLGTGPYAKKKADKKK